MELVSVTTGDYVRLHGAYTPPRYGQLATFSPAAIDGAVLIHGIGGNFYSSRLLNHFATTLQELGVATVLVNTRGHDMVNTVSWGGQAQTVGAAFENVDDCRHDLRAWHDFLVNQGQQRVLFLGHSLGAIKSLYSAAHDRPANLQSVIALSPSRLSYGRMLETSLDGKFQATFDRCQQLVIDGHGELPISVNYPVNTWMTPQCYLDKYGPDENYNWLRFIDQVDVRTLILFGQKELDSHPAFIGLADELLPIRKRSPEIELQTIPDADHFYSSKFGEVDEAILQWLSEVT